MPKISTISKGPQLGNRLATPAALQTSRDIADQNNLSSTIQRINNVKAAFDRLPGEGQRISKTLHTKGQILASSGAERARQLRGIIDKSIGNSQQNASKAVAGKTALIEASNRASSIEAGKGGGINFTS